MRIGRTGKTVGVVAVVVAVVVSVLSISSYWVGSRVEQQFRESVALMARYGAEHNYTFKVDVVDYQRSVFGATALTDLVLVKTSQGTPSVTEVVTVPIIHNIRHGPVFAWAAAARIRSEATEEGIAQYRKFFDADSSEDEVLPVFETEVGLTGKKHLHVSSPGLEATFRDIQIREYKDDGETGHNGLITDIVIDGPSRIEHDEGTLQAGRLTFKSSAAPAEGLKRVYVGKTDLVLDKIQLQWKSENGAVRNLESENFRVTVDTSIKNGAMDTEVKFDADKISVEGETKETADSLKQTRIEHDDGTLQAGRLTFKSNVAPAEGFKRVYVGTTSLVLDKIQLQWKSENGAVRNLESENFRVTVDASIKNGAWDTEVKFDADKISVEGETKETADSLKLTFLLENIDASAYDTILQSMDQDDQTVEIGTVMEKQSVFLLPRKPAFHIKEASGRWPEGVATGSFRIVYEGEAKPDDLSISNLSGLSGDLQLVLPRALVTRHIRSQMSEDIADSLEDGEEIEVNVEKETTERVDKKMAAMLEKGIFVEKGDTLAVDARFRNGVLKLNGKQQPIQTLLELLPPFFF